MLKHLRIRNYALIQDLELVPDKGLNIITGETGAGKSIMLGAIGLLLGNRADTKVLLNQEEKCVVEAEFDIGDLNLQELFEEAALDYDRFSIIRREINPQNKSRAFINDTPVTLDILKKIGSELVDVHSQHETLLLASATFQTSLLDAYADNKILLKNYKAHYTLTRKLEEEYQALEQTAAEIRKQHDYNTFLLNELTEATLTEAEEQEILEEELNRLENAEEIKNRLNIALNALDQAEFSSLDQLQSALKNIEAITSFSKTYVDLAQRLQSIFLEVKDLASELEKEEQKIEFDEERNTQIRERLTLIFSLQQKHQVQSLPELIRIQSELEEKVKETANLDDRLAEIKKQLEKERGCMLDAAKHLTESRKKEKKEIEAEVARLLREVGIENGSFRIDIQSASPGNLGMDKISFLFSANKGITPAELKNVASGGEFSRLLLCLKYLLARKASIPVIIFDEIDTGISGEIAIKVARIVKQMAEKHQIIAISHLPQMAALGKKQFFVFKDEHKERTISRIKLLTEDERVLQIAKMIGGENPSPTAIQNARELMTL